MSAVKARILCLKHRNELDSAFWFVQSSGFSSVWTNQKAELSTAVSSLSITFQQYKLSQVTDVNTGARDKWSNHNFSPSVIDLYMKGLLRLKIYIFLKHSWKQTILLEMAHPPVTMKTAIMNA